MASNDSNNKFLHPLRFFLLFTLLVFLLLALVFYALPALFLTAFVLPMVYAAATAALFAALSFLIERPTSDNAQTPVTEVNAQTEQYPTSSAAKPPSFITVLPEDIINKVSGYLNAEEMAALAITSKPLNELTKDPMMVGKLLRLVTRGEQDQAEAMLKKNPELALALGRGTVTDLSKRTFNDISAFQYALWAMDWHMWKMLLNYLPFEAAALQFQELEKKGTAHGQHFSLTPLIKALNDYVKNYNSWSPKQLRTHWIQQVGGAQLLLPAHVINEYCHPSRPFSHCPDFSADVQLPRSMKIDTGEWFMAACNGGTLGIKFGVVRSSSCGPQRGGAEGTGTGGMWRSVAYDRDALQSLLNTRQQQLLGLKNDLASRVEPMIGLGR